MEGFAACFAELDDPRTGNAARHTMLEMLVIALCSVLTGGEDCTDTAEFAETKIDFLRGFLELKHGAPSHHTFSRLFRLLDPEQFRACFQRFMARFAEAARGVVAIDDKVLRRSFDTASGQSPLHMVSAWACEQQLVLGQIATEANYSCQLAPTMTRAGQVLHRYLTCRCLVMLFPAAISGHYARSANA